MDEHRLRNLNAKKRVETAVYKGGGVDVGNYGDG
jgi:hypothetical protein